MDGYGSLTYPQFGFKLREEVLRLSKIGNVRIILHRPIEGRVNTLTVAWSRAGRWYAVFSSEVDARPIRSRLQAVGVDLGLNNLVALSDGTTIEAPRSYRVTEGRLRSARLVAYAD